MGGSVGRPDGMLKWVRGQRPWCGRGQWSVTLSLYLYRYKTSPSLGILNNATSSTQYNRLFHNERRSCANVMIADK